MKVAWVGTHVPEFSRNRRLAEWFAATGFEVSRVRVPLWPADRVNAFASGRWRLFLKAAMAYPVLLAKLAVRSRPDVYFVSYPGWLDMPVVKAVAMLKRRPIVFDPFISLFDTAVSDRGLADPASMIARLARSADRWALRCADVVVADCPAHGRVFSELAGRDLELKVLFVGADEGVMFPRVEVAVDRRRVLFYGTYSPLQGAEWIVRAAAVLRQREVDVEVMMVGDGQERPRIEAIAGESGAENVVFENPVTLEDLSHEINRAAVVLGIFGMSDKANRVIPHKVFDAAACGRPILTGDTEAIHEGFSTEEVAVVRPGNAEALADALASLLESPDSLVRMGVAARAAFVERYSHDVQVDSLRAILECAVGRGSS